jgi:GTP-binding protein EngB required for normal cell division
MPALEPEMKVTREPGELNHSQQRRLTVTCEYIDKMLSDMENVLHSAASQSPFPRYAVDLSPARARVIEDHIRRLRSQLLRVLAWQHMKPRLPDIPATRAVTTQLAFIDIAIEELKPSYMNGYGSVPEDAVAELNGVVYELRSLVESMERFVRQEIGVDLESRLRRLEETGCDVALLQLIEKIVTRHGLVEFRSRIDLLASRLEDNNLEVALFGRVSSGKSSLLNALLNTDVLPVGVNPITAVPTKLRYGPSLRGTVTYGDGRTENITVEELGKLITEQGNPGNLRSVAIAIAEVPSPRLRQGIVLVDTPGLGSLAKRGSAETLAYLPSCDLALLLIDAGTTLNEEDIGTLRLLYEAGIPAIILLSKADLLAEEDINRAILYIQKHLQHELGLEIGVHPVSSLPDRLSLLDGFFERELLPRFNRARGLRNNSVARKIGALRESVTAALDTILEQKRRRGPDFPTDLHNLEEKLRLVTGEVGEQRTLLQRSFSQLGETPRSILDAVENDALAWVQTHHTGRIPSLQLSEWLHTSVQDSVERCLENVRSALQRAIDTLQMVAQRLGRSDVPAHNDVEILFRGVPRFELAMNPNEINMNHWMLLGEGIVRSRIRNSLQQTVGVALKEELHQYGNSLYQWTREFMNKVEMLSNSYADAYRIQLQRITGSSKETVDIPELERDLALLRNWDIAEGSNALRRLG